MGKMNWELVMKLGTIGVAVVALCVSFCGACNTTTTGHILDNLNGCERHYDGAVSAGMTGGQFSGTVKVDCKSASPAAVTPGAVVGTLPAAPATPPA